MTVHWVSRRLGTASSPPPARQVSDSDLSGIRGAGDRQPTRSVPPLPTEHLTRIFDGSLRFSPAALPPVGAIRAIEHRLTFAMKAAAAFAAAWFAAAMIMGAH